MKSVLRHCGNLKVARRRPGFVAGLAALVATVIGCGGILGVEPITFENTPLGPGQTAASVECSFARDCPEIETDPAGCAAADCNGGHCAYHAADRDQDGHTSAHCAAKNGATVALGDDCDDTNPQLYPGHETECAEAPNGTPITFPGGAPVGICKWGKRICNGDGSVGPCVGAVGPAPIPDACTDTIDEGCTGNPLEGCACTDGQTTPCGSSAVGNCRKGTATCTANKFGACSGNQEPGVRDCNANADIDCNGAIDHDEAACQCAGGGAVGSTRPCNGHPQDGTGLCHAGSQSCVATGSSAAWTGCVGDVGPQTEGCDDQDHDCNGVSGLNDPAPPPPDGTINCTHIFRCGQPDRGPLYYRIGVGFTNYPSSDPANNIWIAWAPRGKFSDGSYPPGTFRIANDGAGPGIDLAPSVSQVSDVLADLEASFGPFPHPSMLVNFDPSRSMEYAGAARTKSFALRHEMCHSYFGRSAQPATGVELWFDEGVCQWFVEQRARPAALGTSESRVVGRPYSRATPASAYEVGSRVIAQLHGIFGADASSPMAGGMIPVLRDFHHRFENKVFTEKDFEDTLIASWPANAPVSAEDFIRTKVWGHDTYNPTDF